VQLDSTNIVEFIGILMFASF